MSGNICRCGAYANIVAAIREVHSGKEVSQNWQFAEQQNIPVLADYKNEGGAHASV
jgi:xanthine dehydrogenase iron-sulfur cluster and FAD-binding subunit A